MAKPTEEDWDRLEWFLINQMMKKSSKQIREYTFTPEQLNSKKYDLSVFKNVKWLTIQRWVKKEWQFRKTTHVSTPFLDIGHWVKFKW